MTGHIHAAQMLQYAQDAAETDEPWLRWQAKRFNTGWTPLHEHPVWALHYEYRRKPRTIRIGEFDVPEPLHEAVPDQADYWLAEIAYGQARARECCNFTPSTCLMHIASGVAHLTREAAELHARALLSLTQVQP